MKSLVFYQFMLINMMNKRGIWDKTGTTGDKRMKPFIRLFLITCLRSLRKQPEVLVIISPALWPPPYETCLKLLQEKIFQLPKQPRLAAAKHILIRISSVCPLV